ncbi:phosphonomutase [Lysobacter helvus]|uniref:Phosphonomutase n=2 Tax=Lysobacteraceae TaxID=32033 RepID=A0ABN6FT08_9GAMM|nr:MULTISPECIES: isocitrate lyase/phosphoenolpyruvate mutase family protein [Lysobacter]BCT91656.1 phosphonomutase [Lysobacter caseinilyticus]BCT94809.1 phosphonomutase [Lysobacter helvus]
MQADLALRLQTLHAQAAPLVVYNAWDAGSAGAIREAGSPLVATSSWAIAAAQGYEDGEALPLDVLAQIVPRIVAKVPDVPVTVDFEGGYAEDGATVANNVARLLDLGVVGINFEDRVVKGKGLYSIEAQSARIAAIRAMAEVRGIPMFINARSDVYFDDGFAPEQRLEAAKARAAAYASAGASGFFAPGLANIDEIRALCASTPLPVNVMMWPGLPDLAALTQAGVKRISHGPGPYRAAMQGVQAAASALFGTGRR